MPRRRWSRLALVAFAMTSCDPGTAGSGPDGAPARDAAITGSDGAIATADLALPIDAALPPPCTTRITYGSSWIHPQGHPQQYDDSPGLVTWDGACTDDGSGNSYATLSNGWQPFFAGHDACVIALDAPNCAGAPTSCGTRVTYGAAWLPPQNHPDQFDDLDGKLTWDGNCRDSGSQSFASLSNGWTPYFAGNGACAMSLRYTACGGLYDNPVVDGDCPDPGVLRDGNAYVLVCTSGNAPDAFPIRTSTDLVSWTQVGSIFPSGSKPAWAVGDFWAPEIHRVGSGYVAYFSARAGDGRLKIGAATATSALGPFRDIGQPLVEDASLGLIDATEVSDGAGQPYAIWKVDGNAVGQHTPIEGQPLTADGTALTGQRATLITNDEAWEGGVVEGPWVYVESGTYYLFYSGNAYYNGSYAVGVAQSGAPLGPYTKLGSPILTTNGAWVGPGHCSVVDAPDGASTIVYHAWQAGHVNGAGDGRLVLVDAVLWSGGWPSVPEAPSFTSRPLP